MKYKARVIVEIDLVADNPELAVDTINRYGRVVQVIGIVPASEPWPSEENVPEEFRRPPRNTPPSGSPGTPIIEAQPEPATAVAA